MHKITVIALGLLLLLGTAGCAAGGGNGAEGTQDTQQGTADNASGSTANDTAGNDAAAPRAGQTPQTPPAQQGPTDLLKASFKVTPQQALDLAKTKGKGDVTKLELELENQAYAYKVEMMTDTQKTKVGIGADDQSIIFNKTEPLEKNKIKTDRQQSKIDLTGIIDAKKAMEIATQKVNGTATKWKIERKNGPTYYEVDVQSGNKENEIKVDAKTGKVLSVEGND